MSNAQTAAQTGAPIPPGSWLGLLGGGQLGRMFCMAAQSMGYKVCVLDPGAEGPAASVADKHIRADYLDPAGLAELAALCAAVTTEFENVPAQALEYLADRCFVSPRANAVAIAQDRIAEKAFVTQAGIPVAPYAAVMQAADLDTAAHLLPGILKAARLGYDGKGQARVKTVEEARAAFAAMGQVPCVLEKMMALELELSVVVARHGAPSIADHVADDALKTPMERAFPASENQHQGGILDVSVVPARVSPTLAAQATELALRVARGLDYVGVLCVEFFVVGGQLLVNEIAPRPHNSGHYTIDACVTSQFEQQARILARLPLGDTAAMRPSVMVNLLGDAWFKHGSEQAPDWAMLLAAERVKLHLYGKAEARAGRKMGHFVVLGEAEHAPVSEVLEKALALRAAL